jgi:hypothetical protein
MYVYEAILKKCVIIWGIFNIDDVLEFRLTYVFKDTCLLIYYPSVLLEPEDEGSAFLRKITKFYKTIWRQ